MEMPKPTEQHKTLAAFVGTWRGEEILYPSPWSPEERTAIGQFHYRMALDGFFLISNYEETQAGNVTYCGHGVYGYDPKEERFSMHWFDSMGGSYIKPALGTWNGRSLSFQNQSPEGQARYTHTLEENGEYGFKIEVSDDGEIWTAFMSGVYQRD